MMAVIQAVQLSIVPSFMIVSVLGISCLSLGSHGAVAYVSLDMFHTPCLALAWHCSRHLCTRHRVQYYYVNYYSLFQPLIDLSSTTDINQLISTADVTDSRRNSVFTFVSTLTEKLEN